MRKAGPKQKTWAKNIAKSRAKRLRKAGPKYCEKPGRYNYEGGLPPRNSMAPHPACGSMGGGGGKKIAAPQFHTWSPTALLTVALSGLTNVDRTGNSTFHLIWPQPNVSFAAPLYPTAGASGSFKHPAFAPSSWAAGGRRRAAGRAQKRVIYGWPWRWGVCRSGVGVCVKAGLYEYTRATEVNRGNPRLTGG